MILWPTATGLIAFHRLGRVQRGHVQEARQTFQRESVPIASASVLLPGREELRFELGMQCLQYRFREERRSARRWAGTVHARAFRRHKVRDPTQPPSL